MPGAYGIIAHPSANIDISDGMFDVQQLVKDEEKEEEDQQVRFVCTGAVHNESCQTRYL